MAKPDSVEISYQKLEDGIVEAFKKYEQGLWPYVMRYEARSIIEASKVQNEDD